MRPISKQTIDDIISLLDQGHTLSQIHSQTGVHTSTISRLRKKLMPDCPKSKGGCPRKLCPTAVRHAQRIIGTGEANTAVDKAGHGYGSGVDFHIQTQRLTHGF